MAQLSLGKIVLVLCTVGVVVGGISIGKTVEHEGVHGHSPIGGRRIEGMVVPCSPVVEGIGSGFISIKIIQYLLCIIAKGEDSRAVDEQQQASTERRWSSHGGMSQRDCCWTQRLKSPSFVPVQSLTVAADNRGQKNLPLRLVL